MQNQAELSDVLLRTCTHTFKRLQAINNMLALFFFYKRNQKPLAFAEHAHWSEVSLKLTCHQRKISLSFFLPLSLLNEEVTDGNKNISHTQKHLEFLLGLCKKLHPKQVHKTSHFIKKQNLKIAKLRLFRKPFLCFYEETLSSVWEKYKILCFKNNCYL